MSTQPQPDVSESAPNAEQPTGTATALPVNRQPSRPRARLLRPEVSTRHGDDYRGEPVGTNRIYVAWLQRASMLQDAILIANQFSGKGSMWQNPFAMPDPVSAVKRASVWFTAYPISLIPKQDESVLETLGDPELWKIFQEIGIGATHTGPVKRAGGLVGWNTTPSVDGHFDRISTDIDPGFGTEDQFRAMCEVAADYGGIIIDDLIPGHTGKGPDFRLAEMAVGDYPGVYHMVEISQPDWHHLPAVSPDRDCVNLDVAAELAMAKAGYIVGPLQRVIFHEPGVKATNWSATAAVIGPDGIERRWVYLHYFKEGQPSINWLDPSFAGMRLVIGDAVHSLGDLGSGGLRLDANGLLGVEKSEGELPAWSEGHPLSEAANHLIASMVRKLGGFTFQEFNMAFDEIHQASLTGADLSYDFVNRPAYHYAVLTQDTEFLRLMMNTALNCGIAPVGLVHALQNHDELTYELVHLERHSEVMYPFRGRQLSGAELGEVIRAELVELLTGPRAPYNARFSTNGVACTTASVISAALGIQDLEEIDAAATAAITKAHLLLAQFNALQPGVFALSGWDLCGILPLDRRDVSELLIAGDTRWINRGAYDLLGHAHPGGNGSGIRAGRNLYGTLAEQVVNPDSFLSGLRRIISVRRDAGLDIAEQVDIPQVPYPGLLVMVHRIEADSYQATVLNFSQQEFTGTITSRYFEPGASVIEMFEDKNIGCVDMLGGVAVTIGPHDGLSLLFAPPGDGANVHDRAPEQPANLGTNLQ